MSDTQQASHPCAACGGSGKGREWAKCGWYPIACPVCLGTGRISDRMPARDAVADAETLVRYIADLPSAGLASDEEWRLQGALAASSYAYSAMTWGLAVYVPGRTDGAKTRKRSMHVRSYSLLAARAAFRAVPGLREGK